MKPEILEKVLECRVNHDDNPKIRKFLFRLLSDLWEKEEEFNSKRPFGDSGWKFDILYALWENGFIQGETDENHELLDYPDEEIQKGYDIIQQVITYLFTK